MKEIKIKDKTYPCRVTMGALLRFKRASGKDISQADLSDLSETLLFVWCCIQSASKADGVAFDLSFDDFADLLEPEDFTEFFGEVQSEAQKKTATSANRKQKPKA